MFRATTSPLNSRIPVSGGPSTCDIVELVTPLTTFVAIYRATPNRVSAADLHAWGREGWWRAKHCMHAGLHMRRDGMVTPHASLGLSL